MMVTALRVNKIMSTLYQVLLTISPYRRSIQRLGDVKLHRTTRFLYLTTLSIPGVSFMTHVPSTLSGQFYYITFYQSLSMQIFDHNSFL